MLSQEANREKGPIRGVGGETSVNRPIPAEGSDWMKADWVTMLQKRGREGRRRCAIWLKKNTMAGSTFRGYLRGRRAVIPSLCAKPKKCTDSQRVNEGKGRGNPS